MADDCGASTTFGLSDPTNLSRKTRQEDSSNDGVTSKNVISDTEERVEPMIHLPLPNVFKSKSEVYRAKQRFTPLEVENLRTARTERIVHDRKQPSHGDEAVMNAVTDIISNLVVVIGGDRLQDPVARQKLKEYREYMEKRSQNLIRIPKSQDRKLKKGKWKK